MNTPKIRFKGFKDDWEQRKLGALMEDGIILEQSDGNHGELYPRSEEFVNEGIPYIAASSISSDGERIDFNLTKYLSMERAIQFRKGVAKNGDVLLAHNATVGPSVMLSMDYEFAILSTSLTLYRLDKEKMSPMFFLQAIRSGYFQKQLEVFMKQTTRSQVPILTQRNLQISYPINKVEQERIGEFLSNLDHLITLHQRKCDETKQLKKFMLQKMFPKNGEKNPEIRFEGFTDDWEQRKLGEVAEYRNGKAHENEIDEDGEYIVVNSKFVSTNAEIRKFSNAQNEPLYENEIAFVLSDVPNGRAIARTFLVDKSGKYTLNQRIAGITPHEDTDPYYLHIRMNRNAYFLKFDDGNKQTNLSIKDVLNYEDMYPSYKEQHKIGSYFRQLDHIITLHQRKCEKLKELKKFMLQNMFV